MKLLETLTAMNTKRKTTPTLEITQHVKEAATNVVQQSTCIYGHKEGTKEYFDMVEELEFLRKHDPSLYRKIMSLD